MIIHNHTHEKEFAFCQALAPDYYCSWKAPMGGSIKDVCLSTECMFVYMTPWCTSLAAIYDANHSLS